MKLVNLFLLIVCFLGIACGQQISYKENVIDGPVMDVLYCKTGNGIFNILIQSENGTLYTSEDDGFTFRDRSNDFTRAMAK